MNSSRPIDPIAVAITLVLCLSWAFQQIAVKFALPEVGPLGQGTVRSAGATLLISIFILLRLRSSWVSGLNKPGLLAGTLFGVEFVLVFLSLAYTDASRAVLFIYVAPFVVAVGGHFFIPGEHMDQKSWIGTALAFVGVAVALNPGRAVGGDMLLGDLLALGGGILWGFTTLVIRGSRLRKAPAAQVLWYQLAISTVIFFAAGMHFDDTPFVPMGSISIAALVYQTVWVTTISYYIWFALIARYSATSLSVISFMTPIFGVVLGHLVLGEELTSRLIFAVLAVAAGIFLVSLPRRPESANASISP